MRSILLKSALALLTLILPITAGMAAMVPAPAVSLASDVYVEHARDANRVLERREQLRSGDRVVTILSWRRALPGKAFTVINPLPRALRFDSSADGSEEISTDGGRTWGRLGQLRIDGRLATPQEVTHLRWRVATPATAGRIAYRTIVR